MIFDSARDDLPSRAYEQMKRKRGILHELWQS